jgi:hypothetical protein
VTTSSVDALRKVHRSVPEERQQIATEMKHATPKTPAEPVPPKKEPKPSVEGRDDHLGQLLKKKRDRENPEDNQ